MRVDGACFLLDEEDQAREVALLAREDHESPAALAALSGVPVSDVQVFLEDLDPACSTDLLAARCGEWIGPLAFEGRFLVMLVRNKTPPTLADPEIRRRAERAALDRFLTRAIDDYVKWHRPL